MKLFSTLLLFLSFVNNSYSQTQFWSDDFETSSPTSGTRTPEGSGGVGGPPNTSYFKLTDGTTVSQAVAFSGKQGTNYWTGEDHNAAGTGLPSAGAATDDVNNELSITWTGINITGKTDLQFKGSFAANSTSQSWDNKNACLSGVATTNTDYVIIQYRIDAGTWTDLLRFYNKGSASGTGLVWKNLYEDTDNNGCGDGTMLTNEFGEFVKSIAGTGTTLDLKLNVYSEGANEEWGVDNFRLFSGDILPVRLVNFSGTSEPGGNRLNWVTASEENNKHFEIESSVNGIFFEKIGIIEGNGISTTINNYTFKDINPAYSSTYYRLKQVDFDDRFVYSRIILIKSNPKTQINLYPNPVTNKLTVELNEPAYSNSKIQLFDIIGKQLPVEFSGTGNLRHGNLNNLTDGLYLIKIVTSNEVVTRIIVKR